MKRVRDEYDSEAFDRADKAIDDFIESRIEKYGNNYTLRDLDDEDLDELDRLTEKAHRIVKGDEVPYESYREYLSKTSDSKKISDNHLSLNYKENEQIEIMIFEKISSLSASDFDDKYEFFKVAGEVGFTISLLDKDMSELGYTFVSEKEPMGYDLLRIYENDNVETYLFLKEMTGVDERNKPLKGYYELVQANSYYKVSDSKKIKDDESNRNPNAEKAVDMLEDELHNMGYDMYIKGGYKGSPYSVFTGFGSLTRLDRIESFIKEHKEFKVTEKNDERSTIEFVYIGDSCKIKDADETPDVLDGILMIAFNDGSEDEGYNEVKKHANEQGELDGVQYETYDTDIQDGVTLIDLCAMTDDANGFVKALLNEWGVIESVADIEFEASDNMKEAVSDSVKIKDEDVSAEYKDKVYWQKGKWSIRKTNYGLAVSDGWYTDLITIYDYETPRVGYEMNIAPDFVKRKVLELVKKGVLVNREDEVSDSRRIKDSNEDELNDFLQIIYTAVKDHNLKVQGKQNWHDNTLEIEFGEDFLFKNPAKIKIKQGSFQEMKTDLFSQISKWLSKHTKRDAFANRIRDMYNGLVYRLNNYVSDSKVEDMTKPAHLRGYAEKYRKKRREQKESCKENEEETQDKEVSDSRRIKDSDDEYLLQEIANQLEEGYHAGYDPQWDIDITVDGKDISEFNYDDQDLIYQDIAYVVKDGYDNYMGIETELSDGSIVYLDFVLNY